MDMSNTTKRVPLIDGDEVDVVYAPKDFYAYLRRAGKRASVKRRIRRRERREGAQQLRWFDERHELPDF